MYHGCRRFGWLAVGPWRLGGGGERTLAVASHKCHSSCGGGQTDSKHQDDRVSPGRTSRRTATALPQLHTYTIRLKLRPVRQGNHALFFAPPLAAGAFPLPFAAALALPFAGPASASSSSLSSLALSMNVSSTWARPSLRLVSRRTSSVLMVLRFAWLRDASDVSGRGGKCLCWGTGERGNGVWGGGWGGAHCANDSRSFATFSMGHVLSAGWLRRRRRIKRAGKAPQRTRLGVHQLRQRTDELRRGIDAKGQQLVVDDLADAEPECRLQSLRDAQDVSIRPGLRGPRWADKSWETGREGGGAQLASR